MANRSFFENLEDLNKQVVLIKEILKQDSPLIYVTEVQQSYGTNFGKKSTGYQWIRNWFLDMKKRGIVKLVRSYPLQYELNEDWRECLVAVIKSLNEIQEMKESAMSKELIKSKSIREEKHGKEKIRK